MSERAGSEVVAVPTAEVLTAPPVRRRRSRGGKTASASPRLVPRHVFRTRQGRILAGVCAGIAREHGIDPSVLRSLAVLSCFVGGAGFVAYLAATLLLPHDGRERGEPARPRRSPGHQEGTLWLGFSLIVLGSLLLRAFSFYDYRLFGLDRGAIWPALLATMMIALLGWRRRDPEARTAMASHPLARPRDDRLIWGLASGLARYAGVDVNLVRAVLCVTAVWSLGMTVLFYFAVGAFVPEDPPSP